MAKKNKKNSEAHPEGLSRRQAKLAARAQERAALEVDPRPFKDFALEPVLIALREFVPSAHLSVPINGGTEEVIIASVLPGAHAAVVRPAEAGGARMVGLQTQNRGNNPHKDLAYALNFAISAQPGDTLISAVADGTEPELSSLLDPQTLAEVSVEPDFNWWLTEEELADPQIQHTMKDANDSVLPSKKIDADITGDAWWIDPGEKAHIRWIRPEAEEQLIDALARVSAEGNLNLGDDTKFAGVFRAHGVTVPVFDLPTGKEAREFAKNLEQLDKELEKALQKDGEQLDAQERKAKQNINSRQVTIW